MPGQKKMLAMEDHGSATVAILYDPGKLQARIDVPLAEAARLAIGQPVRMRSELLPDKIFRGRVTRIAGSADLQRNTLQAKVAIENPDDRLRPEMLCRAEFLPVPDSPETGSDSPAGETRSHPPASGRIRLFVPVAAFTGPVDGSAGVETAVWRVDSSGEAVTPRTIRLGREVREGHRLVVDGLKPGDRVVLDPPADLADGERFRPETTSGPSPAS